MLIREIKPSDNPIIEQIIKATIVEFELPILGTAYEDVETTQMYESYQGKNEVYFVIEENDIVVGGGGIKALKNNTNKVCELQKMYFSPSIRGKGYGKLLIQKCLDTAKIFGYKKCYLESDFSMEAVIHIYKKYGFKHLNKAIEGTGHHACGIWMLKDLDTNFTN